MPNADSKIDKSSPPASEEACQRVAKLYHSGMNCDKAVFEVLKEVLDLSQDRWDFTDFYSDKPDDTDQFLCKVVAAGAISIYLDIITTRGRELGGTAPIAMEPIERVNALVDAMLEETAAGKNEKLVTFDPFGHDRYFENEIVTEEMRYEYRERATRFLIEFQKTFHCQDCVDILGFDPLSYELYDEKTQEEIESGEWMEKCVECMQHIVRVLHRDHAKEGERKGIDKVLATERFVESRDQVTREVKEESMKSFEARERELA